MATYLRPGVYVEETLNPLPPIVGANATSIAAFMGASDRGPTTPTLITSWSQYITKFGGFNTANNNSNALPMAVYMFFTNGGAAAYVYRTAGIGNAASTTTLLDSTSAPALSVSAINPGTWGNGISVAISNVMDMTPTGSTRTWVYDLTVYFGGTTSAYAVETYSNVSNDPTSSRYVNTVLANSNYITATAVTTTYPASTGTTPVTLASGADGAVVTESTIAGSVIGLDTVQNSLVLNACGVVTAVYVDEVISYAEGRGDIFVVVDPSGSTAVNQLSTNATYTASSYAATYYPQLVVANPASTVSGATTTISPSGAVMGLMVRTDTARGVFKSPAGLQARLSGVLGLSATLTNNELDSLNSSNYPSNAIRYIPGSGYVVMGARTLKAGYADRYVAIRRTLIYLRKSLTDLTQFAIFENNDQTLWNSINDVIGKNLTSFWQQGGLRGTTAAEAFFVKCDSTNNTLATINEGIVNIEVGVALQRPAEFVVIKIGQFEGGTTVTVA